jgi:hypothetical protein
MRSISRWGLAPIVIPRWVLVLKYACFIILGAVIFAASSPSLVHLAGDFWTGLFGLCIAAAAAGALIGSTHPRLEALERWCVLALSGLLLGYAIAPVSLVLAGDLDRATYSTIAVTLSLLPASRAWMLIRRTGLNHG